MKLSEIETHNISHRINIQYPIKWSEDDVIATVTEKGVQILEVLYNPNNKVATINCHRHYVDFNENKPTNQSGVNVKSLFMKVDIDDAFHLVMNHDLGPILPRMNDLPSVIKNIDWCPTNGVQYSRRCILAYVTNAGQVSLIGYKFTSWTEILNVSSIWTNHCRKSWGSLTTNAKHQLSELKYRTSRIKITAVVWVKENFSECNNVSHLLTASQDGIITVWKIFKNIIDESDSNNISDCESYICGSVVSSFDSKLTYITVLHWHAISIDTGYIIFGNNQGLISYINCVKLNDVGLNVDRKNIWSIDDRIPISLITSWVHGRGFLCIATKGMYLIVAYIDLNDSKLITVCYHNTQIPFISGIERILENSMLISSRNNQFKLLDLVVEDDNIVVHEREVKCGFMKNNFLLQGFALSRNKVLGAAVLCIKGPYDHIVVREPSILLFFSVSEINEPLGKMLSSEFEHIDDVWDCFDVVRWQILNKIISYALPENLQSALDTMELKQLIITMWLTKFLTTAAEIDEIEEGEGSDGLLNKDKSMALMNTFEEIEELVFSCNIFKRCANLITNAMSLTQFDKESLALMRKWLDHLIISLPDDHITTKSSATMLLEQINDLINRNSIVLPEMEKCSICNDDVPCLTGFKTSRCRRGHQLKRCSLSLVQISYKQIFCCSRCNSVAHELAVSNESPNCIFCNNTLRPDGRLLDIIDENNDEIVDEERLRKEIDDLLNVS